MSDIYFEMKCSNFSVGLLNATRFSSINFANFELDDQMGFNFVFASNNKFKEPYQEIWKKILGTILYFLQIVLGLIPFTLSLFEREGYGGHFRTVLNQLTSWKYTIVSK